MHIFHALFTDALGGLEQAYVNVTQGFIKKGHTVTALMHKHAPYRAVVESLGAEIVALRPHGFYDVFTAWKIRTLLKTRRPDMIVAHGGRAISLMSMAARGTGIPVCGACHSHKTKYVRGADALVALTGSMREHFAAAGFPREAIWVVPNSMYIPPAPPPYSPHRPPIIGAIGRFVPEKGFTDFLRALHLLQQNGVDYIAVLAGDGPQRAMLQALAKKWKLPVRFTGWVNDIPEFYASLDALCVSSVYESFGIVVLEALAYGVPVVSTNQEGPASILTHEVNGLLTPCADVAALARELARLIREPGLAARLAQNGFTRVQDFSFESVAAQWDETLKAVISATTSRRAA